MRKFIFKEMIVIFMYTFLWYTMVSKLDRRETNVSVIW